MIVALSGGVGGARFADGVARLVGQELAVIVNTGDDFEHLGLPISPDLDTVVYTLAGIADPERGWGLAGETWNFTDQIGRLGGPDWFRLGDRDLATHVSRRESLAAGLSLTEFTETLRRKFDLGARVLPMTDQRVSTFVLAAGGKELAFQDYFVRQRCEPVVRGFRFAGSEAALPTATVRQAITHPGLEAIFIGPSNPFVSIDPILEVTGMRRLIQESHAPVVAVSPIISGAAVKGPAAKMMRELGLEVSAVSIARRYEDLLAGIVIDRADSHLAPLIEGMGIAVLMTDALMTSIEDRQRLAAEARAFAATLKARMAVS